MLGEKKTINKIAHRVTFGRLRFYFPAMTRQAMAMTKNIFYAMMALFFVGVIFVLVPKAKAADDHIVINEIYPHVVDSNDGEWIELYNPTASSVALDGYDITDGSGGKPEKLDGMTITAGGYLVISNLTFALNDGGDRVTLGYGAAIDQVIFGKFDDTNATLNASVPDKGRSISRYPNGIDTNIDYKDFIKSYPSPNRQRDIYSDNIIINEILPYPASEKLDECLSADEYIEIQNIGNEIVDLTNWQIDDKDGSGSSKLFTISDGIISSGQYLVFCRKQTGIELSNTVSDSARIIDPNGDQKDNISYDKPHEGQSYSKFNSGWQWMATPTPGALNTLTVEVVTPDQDAPIFQTDISGARNQPDGETVQIIGIVSVVPGKLSSQYFYIQDGKSGIQIYCYYKFFPALSVGDEIRVIGEMATINGERRLKIVQLSDIIILSTHPPPEPIKITIPQIAESYEGEYVEVTGTVTKTSGNTFYIHGSGEIQISIRVGTGIKKPRMSVGDKVQIAGILSQYGDSYRILPIYQSDVKIISSSGLPDTGPGVIYTIIICAIFAWITSAILWRRHPRWQKNF